MEPLDLRDIQRQKLMEIERQKMIKGAILSAKHHGIYLEHGKPNPGLGDCAIESVIFNINERHCYRHKYLMSINYYRRLFVTDMANRTVDSAHLVTSGMVQWLEGNVAARNL